MKAYKSSEVADLLEQAEKLGIQLYSENTIAEIDTLVKQELLKFVGKKERKMTTKLKKIKAVKAWAITNGKEIYGLHIYVTPEEAENVRLNWYDFRPNIKVIPVLITPLTKRK